MARPKQMIKQIVRTISLGGVVAPEHGLFANEDVEAYVSSFLQDGEWELFHVEVLEGYEGYGENQKAGIRILYVLRRISQNPTP